MTLYREPNRQGILFPEGLPKNVEAGLIAQQAVKSVDPTSVDLDAHNYALKSLIPAVFQDRVDELMFDWLNDRIPTERLAHRRFGEFHKQDRQDWLDKARILCRYNEYVHGKDIFGVDATDPTLIEVLHPNDGKFPLVFEGVEGPEEGEKQEDDSSIIVVKGPVYYGFEIDPDANSSIIGGRNVRKIEPVVFSPAGISYAHLNADLHDNYSELSAGQDDSDSIHPSSISNKSAVESNGHYFMPRNLSQALTLALTLPNESRIRFDAARTTTKTDALLHRATDLILRPIQPTSEGWGGSDVTSSVVVLRAIHALFSKHDTTERRDVGTIDSFVASELVRSRHFPSGSRDKIRNFKAYAEIAFDLSEPLGMTPMQVLKAIHKVAPK